MAERKRPKQGIVLEPEGVFSAKALIAALGEALPESQAGFFQQLVLEPHGGRVVDSSLRQAAWRTQIRWVEKTLRREDLRADQQRVECETRYAVIRRMAEGGLGRIQGQQLPDPLPGGGQKLDEPEGPWPQVADAERRREAENGQQNAAGA
jgi:hypothetical protein